MTTPTGTMEAEARAILENTGGDPTARLLAHISLRVSELSSAMTHLADAMLENSSQFVKTEAFVKKTDAKVDRLIYALETSYENGTPPNFEAVKGTCNAEAEDVSSRHDS